MTISISISNEMGLVQGTAASGLPSSAPSSVDPQDASWFAHSIERNDRSIKAGPGNSDLGHSAHNDRLFNSVRMLTERVQEQREDIARHMFKAASTQNPLDMLQTSRLMSDYHLENLLTAKVVGKSAELVEKLTSLQ